MVLWPLSGSEPTGTRGTSVRLTWGSSMVSTAWNRSLDAGLPSWMSSTRSTPMPAARSSATERALRSLIFGRVFVRGAHDDFVRLDRLGCLHHCMERVVGRHNERFDLLARALGHLD